MDCISGGLQDANQGIATQTLSKQLGSADRFQKFLHQCNITSDPFLDTFSTEERILITSAYAHHVRRNRHQHTNKKQLQGSTVAAAISNMVQTFRTHLRPDPTHDATGRRSAILTRQIKGYKASDPSTKSQQCLPIRVWNKINNDRSSPLNIAMADLLIGALFFAMRSCEYSSTSTSDGPRKTKILTCENVQFLVQDKSGLSAIPHTSKLTTLYTADCVTITFISQKNGDKTTKVTQYKSTKGLCPVIAWANTIKRVLSYPHTSNTSTVNTFLNPKNNRLVRISSRQTREHIKLIVKQIGPKSLGVDITRVGTHSIRSSCAMLLYLAKIPTATIMLLGRWKSDAFLLYLRRQVQEFAEGLSTAMMSLPTMFHNIPDNPQHIPTFQSKSDRRQPGITPTDTPKSSSQFHGSNVTNTSSRHRTRRHK
jgi:hypothetical protein